MDSILKPISINSIFLDHENPRLAFKKIEQWTSDRTPLPQKEARKIRKLNRELENELLDQVDSHKAAVERYKKDIELLKIQNNKIDDLSINIVKLS